MTQSCRNFIVLLPSTLLLLANYYGPASALQSGLQCNESRTEYGKNLSCSTNSKILIEFNIKEETNWRLSVIQFNCYNSTPLKFNLPLEMSFPTYVGEVKFNSCRFSANDDILEILTHSLKLNSPGVVMFDNELIDSSLSRANLRGLNRFVENLSFTVSNVTPLPSDLFGDFENLQSLSISSNTTNSSHLSLLIAPLKNLRGMELRTNNLQELPGSIFANQTKLVSLILKSNNILALPSGFFSNISKLRSINLIGNSIPSKNPEDLFLEIEERTEFHLSKDRDELKELPEGLLRNLTSLSTLEITNCQLESISSDIFNGSKRIKLIVIRKNRLHELPVGLFACQKVLRHLDLSKNMIRTLGDGLFNKNKLLEELNLSDNQLTELSNDIFKPLTELKHLYLENNNLLAISSYNNQPPLGSVFDNLNQLEILQLKYNVINEIPYSIMNNSKSLDILDLSFNKISSIDCNFVKYFDSKINLTGNPINCDCRSVCLYQHIHQKSIKEGSIRCEYPSDLKGRSLYDLELSDVLCNISKKCTYNIRTTDSILVMNCSGGNFTDIPTLPTFDQSFSNGIELFMDNNPLTELSSKIFTDSQNITLFSINGSNITKLPKRFLSNLPKLRSVILVLPLETFAEDIFDQSNGITTLKISNTVVEKLPRLDYFEEDYLAYLDLSRNRLKTITRYDSPHVVVRKLETLILSHNFIERLNWLTFFGLIHLRKLYLDNNCLQYMDPDVFRATSSLEFINVENNQLKTIEPFVRLFGTLQTLLMGNNSIGNDYYVGIQRFSPSILDLSFNNISSIDLSHLGSIRVDKTFLNFSNNNIEMINITNKGISLNCNCQITSFEKDNKQMSMYESLRCLSPQILKDHQVSYLSPEELLCPIISTCPDECRCWIRPVNSTLIVNCSHKDLNEVPRLPELKTVFQNGIELSIDNNQLTSLNPHSQSGYKGVTKLFAAHNKIASISSEDIPPNLSQFDISHNQIERLDEKVIEVIQESQTLRSVLLYNNPLVCDCSSEHLTRFVLANTNLFPDIDQCADGRKFSNLTYTEFCVFEQSNVLTAIGIVLSVIFGALLLLLCFYIKKKEHILVWMYAHNVCLWWVTEEELDKDKQYDAFMSYSSLDADFVARELVSKLEGGEKPYKLCLHDRDWLGGAYIPRQIEKSVERSKRTLIVMTEHYSKSKWTRLEFRTAHNASINEKRIRVIVILVGDVNTDNLDSDLQRYIKMYTYIQWGDPWFWEKLYYALPHPSKKNQPSEEYQMEMIRRRNTDDGISYISDDEPFF